MNDLPLVELPLCQKVAYTDGNIKLTRKEANSDTLFFSFLFFLFFSFFKKVRVL
jgi:hypothetical protein